MTVSRRNMMIGTAGLLGTAAWGQASSQSHARSPMNAVGLVSACGQVDGGPVVIATWPFGLDACRESFRVLGLEGRTAMDAVEAGIRVTEADVTNRWVGIGGYPNSEGVLQLDACVMDGQRKRQRTGAVACLEGFKHPISVARLVMEKTPHALFVGADAAKFAKQHGCETAITPCEEAKREWEEWKRQQSKQGVNPESQELTPLSGHDTITLLALSADGHMAGGCSTSGLKFKMPGRVGDSPIIGGGLYVDEKVGAAGATGTGENILRYCGTFLAVELMREGATPEEACSKVIARIAEGEQRSPSELSVNFLALDRQGRYAAVGTDADFVLSVVAKGINDRFPAKRFT